MWLSAADIGCTSDQRPVHRSSRSTFLVLAAVRASNPPTTYTASPTTAAATSVRDSGAGASAFQRRPEAPATAAEHGLAG
jgi:hypothetical protein